MRIVTPSMSRKARIRPEEPVGSALQQSAFSFHSEWEDCPLAKSEPPSSWQAVVSFLQALPKLILDRF